MEADPKMIIIGAGGAGVPKIPLSVKHKIDELIDTGYVLVEPSSSSYIKSIQPAPFPTLAEFGKGTPVKKGPTPYELPAPTIKKVIPKGHKLFVIEGEEIWALNIKNALRKLLQLK